jgi:hypothetical protein
MAEQKPQVFVMAGLVGLLAMGGAMFFLLAAKQEAAPMPVAQRAPAVVDASPAVVGPPPSVSASVSEAKPGQAQPRDRMARDLERERIWSALRREHGLTPATPGAAAPTPSAAAQLPTLDPQYIKSAIAEQLIPVAIECYESALEDDPELVGTLFATFTIVGAQDIGGIVEDATIGEESTLDSAFVRECMRESLMAVTFEPPADGGRVEVTYPFLFEPE